MKVLYVTAKGGIHDYRFLKKLVEDYEVLLLHYAADELIDEIKNIANLKIISKKPLRKSFPLLSEIRHFKKVENDFKPDITHTGYVWQVGILASINNIHPHLSMAWGSDILTEPDKSYLIKKIVAKVMHQCDHIQCDAEFVKQKILNDYGITENKVTVFPWGIELNIFQRKDKTECRKKLNLEQGKFIILFNRHLELVYGVRYMLEGFKEFCKSKEDVELLIVSDGTLKKEVVNFISDNNLTSKIRFIERVKNTELPDYLNASDVYISPSLSDGSSLSLLEALACGLGIIVSDVPAIKEWISESNGIIVPRENTNAVCEALNKYYINRGLIETHGLKNIEIAKERADWNKNYLKLKEIYNKISGN
jgi:glycosyltransferase involved in cell wall biosynthesis